MWELAWAVAPFALSMTASPGPNNILVAATATNFGIGRTLPQIVGMAAGFWLMLLLVGLGLGQVLQQVPLVHEGLKYLGAAYLLYLGWKIATASAPGSGPAGGKPLSFLGAALFQWVNPKGWIAALGAIALFTRPEGNLAIQALVISSVFALIALPSLTGWAVAGEAAGRLLRTPRHLRIFNLVMAALLVASIITLFI